jgi:hypothetical protein
LTRKTRIPAAVAACLFSCQALASTWLIPGADRVDMVHDARRDIVYVSAGPEIRRYHLPSQSYLDPVVLGGNLSGIDLSPDGETLAVADRSGSATNVWIHLVELESLSATVVPAARAFSESGTWTVAYMADDGLVVSSMYAGSGWVPMRRLDPQTGVWTTLASSVRQNTMLSPSGDGWTLAFAESNSSSGPWGRYEALTGEVVRRQGYDHGTSWFNFEIAANADATRIAIPTYGGTMVYDETHALIATIGSYAGPQPIGVAFHPVEPLVYFPWAGSMDVRVFDSETLQQVDSLHFHDTFQHTGNHAFRQGRTRIARDGSLLMVSTTSGIVARQLYAPLAAQPLTAETSTDASVEIALAGSIGNGGQLQYEVAHEPMHGSVSIDGATATYVPNGYFSGVDQFSYRVRYGMATVDATVTVAVTAPNRPPVAADDVAYTRNKAIDIDVLANDSDPDGDSLAITLLTAPVAGTASIVGDVVRYAPPKGFRGSDTFRYTVSDGNGGSTTARVTVFRD